MEGGLPAPVRTTAGSRRKCWRAVIASFIDLMEGGVLEGGEGNVLGCGMRIPSIGLLRVCVVR